MSKSRLPGNRTIITSDGFSIFPRVLNPGTKVSKSSATAKSAASFGPNTEPEAPLKPYIAHPPAYYKGPTTFVP